MKWSFAQWGLFTVCALHIVQAVIGFIANPSFAIGPDAPTVQILGMDYNGWHAVAGLALFAPGLIFASRKSWAVLYLLLAGAAGALPGLWALFSHQVAYVLRFPHNTTDALIHFATGALMFAIAAIQTHRDGGLRRSLADLRAQHPPQSRQPRGSGRPDTQ